MMIPRKALSIVLFLALGGCGIHHREVHFDGGRANGHPRGRQCFYQTLDLERPALDGLSIVLPDGRILAVMDLDRQALRGMSSFARPASEPGASPARWRIHKKPWDPRRLPRWSLFGGRDVQESDGYYLTLGDDGRPVSLTLLAWYIDGPTEARTWVPALMKSPSMVVHHAPLSETKINELFGPITSMKDRRAM
jgi:hypothetical protein